MRAAASLLVPTSRALCAPLPTFQTRQKFKYITRRRAVGTGDPKRTPTLRQLLTYLDAQANPTGQRVAEQNAPSKKDYRKPKRLVDGLYYDSKNLKRIEDFKIEFAKKYKTQEVFVDTVVTEQERVKQTMAEFDEKMKKFSSKQEEEEKRKREDRLARRKLRRELSARVAEGTASQEDLLAIEAEKDFAKDLDQDQLNEDLQDEAEEAEAAAASAAASAAPAKPAKSPASTSGKKKKK